MSLTLATCRTIADAALATGREKGMKPLGIVIVDARGSVRLTLVEDGNALLRPDIAHGKAFGCVAVGVGGRTLERMAKERPHFIGALGGLSRDRLTPVPGGVLIRDENGSCSAPSGSRATPPTMTRSAPWPALPPPASRPIPASEPGPPAQSKRPVAGPAFFMSDDRMRSVVRRGQSLVVDLGFRICLPRYMPVLRSTWWGGAGCPSPCPRHRSGRRWHRASGACRDARATSFFSERPWNSLLAGRRRKPPGR